MRCLSPISIPRPNGRGNHDRVTVPCSKCVACLNTRKTHWTVRLKEELKVATSAFFVTLTYADAPENGVSVDDIQRYMKRLRKSLSKDYPKTRIRYYLTAEYGGKYGRPHYHFVVFNMPPDAKELLLSSWQLGFIHLGEVNEKTLGYVTKYMIGKNNVPDGKNKTFNLMSKGLGKDYIGRMEDWHINDSTRFYVPLSGGYKTSLPRYYRDKIYDEATRKAHALRCNSVDDIPVSRFDECGDNVFVLDVAIKESYIRRNLRIYKENDIF